MDHLSPMIKDIFPDSKIAKAFSSARTKTSCIVNLALRPHFEQMLVTQMKTQPFALATDGSNDNGLQKMNPLTVRIFELDSGCIGTRFLDMCLSSSSTAEGIFDVLNTALESRGISWKNCVSLGVDNTSVNVGRHNSIMTRVLQKEQSIYVLGCPCHIIHNTAQKGSKAFCESTHFDVDDFLVDLYYYFDKSTKRKFELAEFSSFCDVVYRKIIHHITVRWLSLQAAVDRALQQYEALRSYFLSKDESTPRFQRLQSILSDPATEVYLLFYSNVLHSFVRLNLFLQREEPLIGAVHEQINKFVKLLMSKFIPVSNLAGDISELDYKNKSLQRPDEELQIGFLTLQKLNSLFEDGSIDTAKKKSFFTGVRSFFEETVEYSFKSLPLNDPLLKSSTFTNFIGRTTSNFMQVEYFVNRFNHLLPYSSQNEHAKLEEEFVDYQLLKDEDIPHNVWHEATVVVNEEDGHKYYRMDLIWNYLSSMKSFDGYERFKRLAQVAKLILIIPHSNANEERVFSMVRKNKTPFRPSLGLDKTLPSLITIKLATEEPCHKYEPDSSIVSKAGKVTWEYNKEHQK